MPRRIALVVPNTSYRVNDFLAAAARAEAEVVVASDRCHVLDEVWQWPGGSIVVDFYHPEQAATTIAASGPFRAVIAAEGETSSLVAALAAGRLGLPHNSPAAARAARDKLAMRELCRAAGLPAPRYLVMPADGPVDAARIARAVGFPCVLKPRVLSASRGVIRADDEAGLRAAHARVAALLALPAVRALDPEATRTILVESFVPGPEVAFEGILEAGALRPLALFDKPDPLDGPFFEETIYVTPSRLPAAAQAEVARATAEAARAMGLSFGPVHAELRLSPSGPVVIEVAARSIGGLCSRTLRFGTGWTLEDLIVRQALGERLTPEGGQREHGAAGVMMIPIPRAGVLRAVEGLDAARAVPGVEEVVISARLEQELEPLPEGASYLGFLFARGDRPEEVERALREAHRAIRLTIVPTLPAL